MPGSGGPWRAVACEWERSEEGSRGWDGVQSEEVHLKKKKTNIYFWCNLLKEKFTQKRKLSLLTIMHHSESVELLSKVVDEDIGKETLKVFVQRSQTDL